MRAAELDKFEAITESVPGSLDQAVRNLLDAGNVGKGHSFDVTLFVIFK
jgi:hypothetical protein